MKVCPIWPLVILAVVTTTSRHARGEDCVKGAKTRSKQNECSRGKLFIVGRRLARAGQVPEKSRVCLKHKNLIEKKDRRCSFPSRGSHTNSLIDLPIRLYDAVDRLGEANESYTPGTMWCTNCRAREKEVFQTTEGYKPPEKRKRSSTSVKQNEGLGVSENTPTSELSKILQFSNSPIERLQMSLENAKSVLHNSRGSYEEMVSCRRHLTATRRHFQNLFDRLRLLSNNSGITLDKEIHSWSVVETSFGNIALNTRGDVQVDSSVWEQMVKQLENKNTELQEDSFETLVDMFQNALYHHYTNEEPPLYNRFVMHDFAEEHAPGLYNMIFNSISRIDGKQCKERIELQHQRTVVILHTLAYFRSQKTSTLQKDLGLFLNQHGASRSAINSGPIVGYSTAPRTIDCYNDDFRRRFPSILHEKIEKAKKENYFIMLLIDDFHNIYTVRLPQSDLKLSMATHMVSSLLDIHPTMNGIKLPSKIHQIHCCPTVVIDGKEKTCVGGIAKDNVENIMKSGLDIWKSTYMESLPREYHHLSGQGLKKQLHELRVYNGLAHKEMLTLKTCILVDEFEQTLKSMEDYKKAIDHILTCSNNKLQDYLQEHIIPFPGDWPSWYYTKKLIAQTHSSSELNAYASIMPEQGPFHVTLNANEDTIKIHHFFFEKVYNEVFGLQLPLKPKPFRVSLILTGTLCGWLIIRDKILKKFKLCKDPEYICIIHILDEILPLVFFQYGVVFTSGNLQEYQNVMFRFLIIYIIWDRHHYDRSTLSMLNDLFHQKKNFSEYYKFKMDWLSIITEKKVEIWHSLLRFHINIYNTGNDIRNTAIALAASSTATAFFNAFVRPYKRGTNSEKNLKRVAGKTAEVLMTLFQKIGFNLGKSKKLPQETTKAGKPKGRPKFHLETFGTIDNKAMPLSYKFLNEYPLSAPDPHKVCDFDGCERRSQEDSDVIRLPCFHMFHKQCLQKQINDKITDVLTVPSRFSKK